MRKAGTVINTTSNSLPRSRTCRSRLGHGCCEDPPIGGHDDKIKHALKVLIAARLSEGKHVGSPTWGDADDRVKATNLALLATDRDTEHAEALINEMIGEARKLVEQHWPDIEALAQRLLVKGRGGARKHCRTWRSDWIRDKRTSK